MSTTAATPPAPEPPKGWRLVLLRLRTGLAAVFLLLLGVGLIGHLTRDLHLLLTVGFYLPLAVIGLAAALFDVLTLGRAFPKGRFLLALIGVFLALWDATHLWNFHAAAPPERQRPEVRLVQWNVRWGGKPWHQDNWESIEKQVIDSKPDIAIFNEAPFPGTELLERMCERQKWSIVRRGNQDAEYVYQLAICSKWPLFVEEDLDIANGHLMIVRVERSGQPLRVMVVDVESNPLTVPRQVAFDDVYPILEAYADRGTPIDIVGGDFNTPGRSVALDRLPALGYVSAGRWVAGWRGTWPGDFPLYDIDHVFVYRSWSVQSCDLLTNPYTDHRGHRVIVQP